MGKAKSIQPGFPLYDAKSRKNRILRLASNVVQYYSVRLKVRVNMATATTVCRFGGKETVPDRGNWETVPDRGNWGGKYRLFCVENGILTF